jgi:hypothetical protein
LCSVNYCLVIVRGTLIVVQMGSVPVSDHQLSRNCSRIYLPNKGELQNGTMLQSGRSRVRFPMRSLDFSIDLTLTAALWLYGRLSL